MRIATIFPLLYILPLRILTQDISIEPLAILPEAVSESSGVLFIDDKIITHNDSGGEPALYEIDPVSGNLTREVQIENALNIDWEDMAADDQFIYVADFGNNQGDRTDLAIYRIGIEDYLQENNAMVSAEPIFFSYQDQTSYHTDPLTNYDAEALIDYGDSLYIFTKNWGDLHTNIYSLPKTTGSYQAKRVGSINSGGLITGGVYNELTQNIILVGYGLTGPFLIALSEFEGSEFTGAKIERLPFDLEGSIQVEGIDAVNDLEYFITTESNNQGDAMLLRLTAGFVVDLNDNPPQDWLVYPNPARNLLIISGLKLPPESISFYNMLGSMVVTMRSPKTMHDELVYLDLSEFPNGLYQMKVESDNLQLQQRVIVSRLAD